MLIGSLLHLNFVISWVIVQAWWLLHVYIWNKMILYTICMWHGNNNIEYIFYFMKRRNIIISWIISYPVQKKNLKYKSRDVLILQYVLYCGHSFWVMVVMIHSSFGFHGNMEIFHPCRTWKQTDKGRIAIRLVWQQHIQMVTDPLQISNLKVSCGNGHLTLCLLCQVGTLKPPQKSALLRYS